MRLPQDIDSLRRGIRRNIKEEYRGNIRRNIKGDYQKECQEEHQHLPHTLKIASFLSPQAVISCLPPLHLCCVSSVWSVPAALVPTAEVGKFIGAMVPQLRLALGVREGLVALDE